MLGPHVPSLCFLSSPCDLLSVEGHTRLMGLPEISLATPKTISMNTPSCFLWNSLRYFSCRNKRVTSAEIKNHRILYFNTVHWFLQLQNQNMFIPENMQKKCYYEWMTINISNIDTVFCDPEIIMWTEPFFFHCVGINSSLFWILWLDPFGF